MNRAIDDMAKLLRLQEKFEHARRVYLAAVKAEGEAERATMNAGHDMIEAKDRYDRLRDKLDPGCQGTTNDVRCNKRPATLCPTTDKLLCADHLASTANVAIFRDLDNQQETKT